jgi:16S rRNA (guanine966-N2)-methyltransferase
MRITAGEFKGRNLEPPSDRRVRATTEKVREALFNILGASVSGAKVLDLFAGSGVLGLEALSRGADHADFVDVSSRSLRAVRANIATLDVKSRTQVYHGDALRFAERLQDSAYEVVLADPPYATDQAVRLLEIYRRCTFAQVLSVEHPARLDCPGDETRRYGDVALTFCYRS